MSLVGAVSPDDIPSLAAWLQRERLPDTAVAIVHPDVPAGQMGVLPEIVSIVTSGTASALASSLAVWLQNRRGDLEVVIRKGDLSVRVNAKHLAEPDEALREVLAEAQ